MEGGRICHLMRRSELLELFEYSRMDALDTSFLFSSSSAATSHSILNQRLDPWSLLSSWTGGCTQFRQKLHLTLGAFTDHVCCLRSEECKPTAGHHSFLQPEPKLWMENLCFSRLELQEYNQNCFKTVGDLCCLLWFIPMLCWRTQSHSRIQAYFIPLLYC